MNLNISHQGELSYPKIKVLNHKEYNDYETLLDRMNEILTITGMDMKFAESQVEKCQNASDEKLSSSAIRSIVDNAIKAYRCTLVKILIGESYRKVSIHIAESALLQKFCGLARIDYQVTVPTKSTLQRYANMFDEEFIREQIDILLAQATLPSNPLGFVDPFTVDDVFLDATCMKARIHFPVDWVLMKDCMFTILKAIIVLRKHGLRHRIKPPETFLSEINALCMTMTSLSRQSKKKRKAAFRRLKKVAKVILEHGERYARLLVEEWEERTDFTEAEANHVLGRLDKMIATLPEATAQANTRIISERQVENKDKLISVYHENVNVINRGKAGGQQEFGNPLFLAEQADGVIVDWHLYRTDVKEPHGTRECVRRLTEELELELTSVTGDRGCHSKRNESLLKTKGIYSGLCPRNPLEFAERMCDDKFRRLQKRRAQTEGRIGIFKNAILDGSLYERDFEGKQLKVGWAVLTHNLWRIATMLNEERRQMEEAA